MRKLAVILPGAILAVLLILLPSHSHTTRMVTVHPSAPTSTAPALPVCATEDGAGMALCTWHSDHLGHDIISGDCAPDVVGVEASKACVTLHERKSVIIDNADGSSNTIPNGADLVSECTDENQMMTDSEKASEGFDLYHCFLAQMGE